MRCSADTQLHMQLPWHGTMPATVHVTAGTLDTVETLADQATVIQPTLRRCSADSHLRTRCSADTQLHRQTQVHARHTMLCTMPCNHTRSWKWQSHQHKSGSACDMPPHHNACANRWAIHSGTHRAVSTTAQLEQSAPHPHTTLFCKPTTHRVTSGGWRCSNFCSCACTSCS